MKILRGLKQQRWLMNNELESFGNIINNTAFYAKCEHDIFDDPLYYYIREISDKIISEVHNEAICLIDNSIEFDGLFFAFCKDKGYKTINIKCSAIELLSERDLDYYDPYTIYGVYLVEKDDLKFIKAVFQDKDRNDKKSIVCINKKDYPKFRCFRDNYYKWTKETIGMGVAVVGGDDYCIDGNKTFDELFFGENLEFKDSVKNYFDYFLSSETKYLERDLLWKSSILIEGLPGSGKTELINTIISCFDLSPIAINPYNFDESVLTAAISVAENIRKSVLILDDFDDLVAEEIINYDILEKLLENVKANNGMITIVSLKNINEINPIMFDKHFKIPNPQYKASIDLLFGNYFNDKDINKIRKLLKDSKMSYKYIKQIRDLLISKNIQTVNDSAIDLEKFTEIYNYLKSKNDTILGKSIAAEKPKRGLLVKK